MAQISDITISAKPAHGGCNCGATTDEVPELDAMAIPKAIRHPAIFGALDSLKPSEAMVLKASHLPLPLLKQIEKRSPDVFTVSYLEEGPDVWRVQFVRN